MFFLPFFFFSLVLFLEGFVERLWSRRWQGRCVDGLCGRRAWAVNCKRERGRGKGEEKNSFPTPISVLDNFIFAFQVLYLVYPFCTFFFLCFVLFPYIAIAIVHVFQSSFLFKFYFPFLGAMTHGSLCDVVVTYCNHIASQTQMTQRNILFTNFHASKQSLYTWGPVVSAALKFL